MRIIMVFILCHCSEDKLIYACKGTGMILRAPLNIIIEYLLSWKLREFSRKSFLVLKTTSYWSTVSRETKRQKIGIYLCLQKPRWSAFQTMLHLTLLLGTCIGHGACALLFGCWNTLRSKEMMFPYMFHNSHWLLQLFDHKKMSSDFKIFFWAYFRVSFFLSQNETTYCNMTSVPQALLSSGCRYL